MPAPDLPIAELVACVDREAKFRSTTYPRWVKSNKLTAALAEQERIRLAAVRLRLVQSEAVKRIMPALFVKAGFDADGARLLLEEAHESVEVLLPPVPKWLA